MTPNFTQTAAFIWSVADLLRGDFKQSQYGRTILPFTLLRRLECVLENDKAAVLETYAEVSKMNLPEEAAEKLMLRSTEAKFFNTSPMDLSKLGESGIKDNLETYIQSFSRDAREIFEYFKFTKYIAQLGDANLLYKVVQKFASTDLSPKRISNYEMGLVFEELLREKRQAVISHAVTKGLNPDAPMKDSGVEWLGEVPEGWNVAKLSYRYEVLLGKMLDDKKITGAYLGKYLRNTDVQWDRINTDDLPEMDFRPEEQERFSVKKSDLIVCEGGEIGRSAIWEKNESCFYQKALHRLRPIKERTDNTRFMFYVLFDAVHQERFVSGAGKATIAHLPAETFRQYRFVFPPLKEQLLIAEYLDKTKAKFDLIEQKAIDQIELLRERRTALISAAVTDKIDVRKWEPGG